MFYLFILLQFLLGNGGQALPIFAAESSPPANNQSDRTLFNIIWGCFSTMFICAWATVHPNIPSRGECGRKLLWRRLNLMFWTLVAPEVTLAWAVRQWFAAQAIADTYNKHKDLSLEKRNGFKEWFVGRKTSRSAAWTKTHGHFLIMGGFVLIEPDAIAGSLYEHRHSSTGGEGLSPESEGIQQGTPSPWFLTYELLECLLGMESLDFELYITEEDIEDRSKGDFLSKFIAVLQTTWFIVQCLARVVQQLEMTSLELVTLALASLNGVMYFFWWHKPLDVKVPVKVYLKRKLTDEEKKLALGAKISNKEPLFRRLSSMSHSQAIAEEVKILRNAVLGISQIRQYPVDYPLAMKYSAVAFLFRWFLVLPYLVLYPVFAILRSFLSLVYVFLFNTIFSDTVRDNALHVPTFYAPETNNEFNLRIVVVTLCGTVFGGLHVAGWSFTYPTKVEEKLWRVTSLILTLNTLISICMAWVIMIVRKQISRLANVDSDGQRCFARIMLESITLRVLITVGYLMLLQGLIARLSLIVQSLALLRRPPPSALLSVDWTKFIPHVS